MTIPTGDFHADQFGDGFKVGWRGTALVDLQLPASPVGFRVEGTFGENASNDKLTADLSLQNPGTSAMTKLLGGTVDVTYTVGPRRGGIGAYLLGGIGVYDLKLCVIQGSFNGCRSATNGAWNVGWLFRVAIAPSTALVVDARYFDVGSIDGFYGPSIKPTFLSLTAGIRWAF